MFRIFFYCALFFMPGSLQSQDPGLLVPVKDLEKHWLTIDRKGQTYIPYISGNSLNYPVIGFLLDTRVEAGLILECCIPAGTAIFINNKIIDRTRSRDCRLYNIDSLGLQYPEDNLFLSFYAENLDPSLLSTRLLSSQPVLSTGKTDNTAQIRKRATNHFRNFFVIAILIISSFYAFLINQFPKGCRDFFNFSKAFSPTLKEEKILTQRNMSTANALFLWAYSMVISLVIILFWKVLGGIPDIFDFVSLRTFGTSLLSWLMLSILCYGVVGLKFVLIRILCSLLNFDKIAQIHFFDFIRLSMIFVSAVLIALTVIYLTPQDHQTVSFRIVLYVFVVLLSTRILVLLVKLIGVPSFRKIHLISYLCTTEILPLLIGIRIFF